MEKHTGADWEFDMRGLCFLWEKKAEELKHSSDILWVEVDKEFLRLKEVLRNYLSQSEPITDIAPPLPTAIYTSVFIAGLCIENIFKGLIVIDNPDYIKDGKFDRKIKSHNLIYLASMANVHLSDDEKIFCEIAEEAVKSFGRYPLPLKPSDMIGKMTIKAEAKEVYDNLYSRLIPEILIRFENTQKSLK